MLCTYIILLQRYSFVIPKAAKDSVVPSSDIHIPVSHTPAYFYHLQKAVKNISEKKVHNFLFHLFFRLGHTLAHVGPAKAKNNRTFPHIFLFIFQTKANL